ncbi:MAG: EAL domain-containing protein [Ghiorsea sp.]
MQDILIARQPIFDLDNKLTSYELLFRNHPISKSSDEHMTAQVITSLLDFGIDKLSDGHKININVPSSLLLSDLNIIHALPSEHIGIEIQGKSPVNDAFISACQHLKRKGFTVLLDDVVYAPHLIPLFEIVDIIKVDLQRVDDLAEEVKILRQYPAKLLAEKVETNEQLEQVKALGFDLAQGFFFSKPEIIPGKKIKDSKLSILRALQKVMTAEAVSDIHDVIKQDVTLSYRLMKYINSATFGLKQHIESIEQALALLGLNNIRRWLSVLALASLGHHKTPELLKTGLSRAYLLEGIAKQRQETEVGDDFLLGMFSILDALLDVDMEQALQDLYLPTGVREGLLDISTDMGKKLSMSKSLERGEWAEVQQWSKNEKSINIANLSLLYLDAINWSDTQTSEITA